VTITTVLIVDDNSDSRDILSAGFTAMGYHAYTAAHGLEALRVLRTSDTPQAIILDIHMPVMDGFQLITELYLNEATRHIPIVAITGRHDAEQVSELPGVQRAFCKGRFTVRELIQTVAELAPQGTPRAS
jgi:CheY-like chemotaxis protein